MNQTLAGRIMALALPAAAVILAVSAPVRAGEIPSDSKRAEIRRQVETLRGLEFRRDVPVSAISEKELRDLTFREVDKEYPGRKLADYQDFMTWMDMLPAGTDLKEVFATFLAEQAAGMYDPETKRMYIPEKTGAQKKVAGKVDGAAGGFFDGVVYAHEYTHALEDQYWKLEDPADKNSQASTDRAAGRTFLIEGSATHLMVEAVPADAAASSPYGYVVTWNLIHSGMGRAALRAMLLQAWKAKEAETPGVPETLVRGEIMPYSYGYRLCDDIMSDWGLDGLDYAYNHPPVSTEQAMHPGKFWEWRDFPVQVALPETIAGGWTRRMADTAGEAGVSALFGCHFKDFFRGERIAAGWDGDRAALYERPDGGRLLLWASSWDSAWEASRFAAACVEERRAVHKAAVRRQYAGRVEWERPDGRAGFILCDGRRVMLAESDRPEALAGAVLKDVTFTKPPEDAARAAANNAFLRFNPLLSWRKDGDYAVTKSLWGLLWRHDRNAVGASDSVLWGLLGESRRTASLNKWELGWGWIATHESEARRQFTETGLLPWGMLWSHFSTALPQDRANVIRRDSCLWGLACSRTRNRDCGDLRLLPFGMLFSYDWKAPAKGGKACGRSEYGVLWGLAGKWTATERGGHKLRLLPGGLLFRCDTGPQSAAVHVLGTGVSRTPEATRVRVLGIPVYAG